MIEQHWSLTEKFIKKWFWLYLFTYIVSPMWYIVKIIISTDLTVSEVWLIYWIISLIVLVSAYHDLWITESINYFIPKFVTENRYDKVKTLIFYWFIVQIFTWIILASFFYFWSDYLAIHYFESKEAAELLKIFAFFFLIVNFLQIITTFFMSIQNTYYAKIVELFRMSFTLITTILIFILNYWDIITYSYAWLFWVIIWTIYAIIKFYKSYYKKYLKWVKFNFEIDIVKEVFKYSLLVFLSAQAWTILWQIDMQMVIYYLWTESAWYYTNYLSIINIPFMLIWPMFWLLLPVISELNWKNENNKILTVKTIFVKQFINIAIFSNILFFVFAEIIAFILFWEKFIMSWTILKYSILFLVFNYLLHINFQILSWIWKVKYKLYIMLFAIASNIVMNYIFINKIWVVWASLATWIWWIIIWILSEYYLWKKYLIKYSILSHVKNLLIFITIWILSYYYILPNINWFSRLQLLISMTITTLFYLIIFISVNYNEILSLVKEIKIVKKSLK